MENAERDQNRVTTLIAVSSADGITPVKLYADPVTHRLLVEATGTGSSPLTTKGDIYVFGSSNSRLPVGTDGQILVADSTQALGVKWQTAGAGTGDVVGPASSTDNAVARFDLATGKLIQNSGVTISDTNVISASGLIDSSLTASQLLGTNGSKQLVSLDTATYPSLTELTYLKGVSSAIQTQFSNKQPLDATLTALAAYNTNGILTQTTADTFVGRTITGTTNQITMTNGDGVSGNPTIAIASAAFTNAWYVSGSTSWSGAQWAMLTDTQGQTKMGVSNTTSTLTANYSGFGFVSTPAMTSAATGTHALIANIGLKAVSLTGGGATLTNSATLYIEGAASFATNNYALWIDSGDSRIDGNIYAMGVTANRMLYIDSNGLITGISYTGTGNAVLATSPTLTTPTLGVATATSINKVTITAPATGSTLTIDDGKTFRVMKTITLDGTDSTTMTFPSSSATIARTDAGQTFTGTQIMTSPKILTSILDTNGNESIIFATVASAVNEVTITNAATGNGPIISATGEANVSLNITSKGTGGITFWSGTSSRELLKLVDVASAVNEITLRGAAAGSAVSVEASGDDTNIDLRLVGKGTGIPKGERHYFQVRLKDSTTALTTGTSIGGDFRISPSRAITIKAVGAYVDTAPTGASLLTIDINEAGTTILSTKITLDASEKTSTTAATAPVISDTAIAADAIITFDIDQVGSTVAGSGLVVWIEYEYA